MPKKIIPFPVPAVTDPDAPLMTITRARYEANMKAFAFFDLRLKAGVEVRGNAAAKFGQILALLQADARALGISLPEEVARYIV